MNMALSTLVGSCRHGAPIVLPLGAFASGLRTDAAPCGPRIALRSVRAASRSGPAQRAGRSGGCAACRASDPRSPCPDSRARHPCPAYRDPRPTGHGSARLLLRRFPGQWLSRLSDDRGRDARKPPVVPDRGAWHCSSSYPEVNACSTSGLRATTRCAAQGRIAKRDERAESRAAKAMGLPLSWRPNPEAPGSRSVGSPYPVSRVLPAGGRGKQNMDVLRASRGRMPRPSEERPPGGRARRPSEARNRSRQVPPSA